MNKIIENDYGMFYESGDGQIFTDEEIAEKNSKELAKQKEALSLIANDGFIKFPIFTQDHDGNTVEKEAWLPPTFEPSCMVGFKEKHGMDYNIYIPSYERAGTAKTIDMLEEFGVKNYYICIDPAQYEKYKEAYPKERLVIRDFTFRDENVLDLVSSIKSPLSFHGHAPLCNFTLSLSRSLGERRFWFMDDDFVGLAMKARKGDQPMGPNEEYNKDDYYRCSKIKESYGFNFQKFMESIEQLAQKFRNPGFIGLEKFGIVFSLPVMWKLGTRVYSFYLTDNKTQVTHLGNHNNDVITSLELSKHGLVNCLFEGISYNSEATQSGGGQTEVYKTFGTLDKGRVLARAQPNYSKISFEYSRIHHKVDYTSYNQQRLVGAPIPDND